MPTERQNALAARLGIELGDAPEPVATAIIYEVVGQLLTGASPPPNSAKQVSYAKLLGVDISRDSKNVASARISFAQAARTNSALAAMALKPGEYVVYEFLTPNPDGTRRKEFTIEEISSISKDGMVYFKNPARDLPSHGRCICGVRKLKSFKRGNSNRGMGRMSTSEFPIAVRRPRVMTTEPVA